MLQLIINNSYSRITGLNAKQEKELREQLSYTIDAKFTYFSGNYGPRKKCLLSKRGEFPTGLMYRLPKWIFANVQDNRKLPKKQLSVKCNIKPYKDQLKALDAAIVYGQGTISMPTGSGKSLVIALIVAKLNLNTLIVVPTLEIKKQLTAVLLETLGPDHKAVVENIDSSSLLVKKHYDCLIIDEAHHVAAKTYQKLNKNIWTDICYRFFLTATPFRNNSEETLLFESIAGQLIYKLDYSTAVKKGYIVPVEAYYIEIPKQKTEAFTYQEVYKELVVHNEIRNTIIRKLLFSLLLSEKSSLCLVKEIQHGKIFAPLPFVSGEDDNNNVIKEFNEGIKKVLIATTGIMGEGIDSKPCEFVVIAGLGKAKSHFMQQVGRSLRKYPGKESAKIIIIKDRSHKYLTRHFNEQVRILKDEYGVVPVKLEI